jgi:hypothetical protein
MAEQGLPRQPMAGGAATGAAAQQERRLRKGLGYWGRDRAGCRSHGTR